MRRVLSRLARINEWLCNATRNVAGLLLAAMVAVVILQILFRYVLNDSLSWTEEVSKTMMVWTAFLVAPWAYRVGANVRIELFADEFPAAMRRLMAIALNLLVLWIVAVFLFESFGFWQRGQAVRSDSLPIQVSWFYTVVPVAFALLSLVAVEQLLRDSLAWLHPDEEIPSPRIDDIFDID